MSSAENKFGQRLKGKVAIVTASTDGIGLAIAERLAIEGAKVVISSRKASNVEKALKYLTGKGLNAHGIQCHVGNGEDRKKLFQTTLEKYGGLDILVSNAAVNPHFGKSLDCSESAWDKIFEINVKSSFLLAKEAVPLLRERGGGNIIFVASIAGYRSSELLGVYGLSKTALLGLTKIIAIEVASENIRVNCVAPGLVETNFSKALMESKVALDEALRDVPLRRAGQPHEMAGVVAFLASDDASYMTGETIVAAGGQYSRL